MSCSTPARQAELSCPINDLADEELAAIFQRLPPYERLFVSEVCRRWRDINRKSWLDVKTLDLSAIPGNHVAAVIRQCASLQQVFALKKWFYLNELVGLSKISCLSRARFYECRFEVKKSACEAFSAVFSDNLRNATWAELVMHDATFYAHTKANSDSDEQLNFSADALPATLTRLQLSGLRCFGFDHLELNQRSFLRGLERLENLECLILHDTPDPNGFATGYDEQLIGKALHESEVFGQICRLQNLKELCLGPVEAIFEDVQLSRSLADLPPTLEVLFLNEVAGDDIADDLMKFIGTNSVLRILVLSGAFRASERVEADVRLPPLHVFLGKRPAAKIRFASKPTAPNTAIVHPIDYAPMPKLLERADIAPLFEGVWVAEKITELAKTLGKLWRFESVFSRQL